MKKLNTQITSKFNRSLVLSRIHQNPDISRAELAVLTGLNRSAITHILKDLLDLGFVVEVRKGEAGARGGRRPIHLQINPAAGVIAAIDIGLTSAKAVFFDLDGHELHRTTTEIDRGDDLVEIVDRMLKQLSEGHREVFDRCVVIGVSCPGIVDPEKGRMILNLYHGWRDVDLAVAIQSRFGKPVFVENDANAAALGELYASGRTESLGSLIYLLIRESTPGVPVPLGVGGAIILNRFLWHGAHSRGGEASYAIHEVFTSIMKELEHRMEGTPTETPQTLGEVLALVDKGHTAAEWAANEMACQIAEFLAEFASFLDTEGVLVSVQPPERKTDFLNRIRVAFFNHTTKTKMASIRFLEPILVDDAALQGTVRLGIEHVFIENPSRESVLFP